MISIGVVLLVVFIVKDFRERQRISEYYENPRIYERHVRDRYKNSSTSVVQYCEYCGESLPTDAVFCPNCGDSINNF